MAHTQTFGLTTVQVHQPSKARPVTTLGQQLLLRLSAPLGEIAASCGVTRAAVSQWRMGAAVPSVRCASLLEATHGIPSAAWRMRPDEAGQPATPPPALPAAPLPKHLTSRTPPPPASQPSEQPADEAPARAPVPQLPAHATSLDHVDAMIAQVVERMNDPRLTSREHASHLDQWRKLMGMRIQAEARAALMEDATIRAHPKWKRLKALIIDALLPFPDAARAVEAAIERAIGEDDQTDD